MTQSENHKAPIDRQNLKTVVITGAGSGIGLETARALIHAQGYRLVLLGRDREKLEDAAQELGGNPDLVSVAVCDLKDSAQVKKTAERIIGTYQGIYAILNNAGVYPFGGIQNTTEESWDETMAINLKAPFLMMQNFAPAMAKHPDGGRIINVSSTAGILPNHFATAYSVSKAALIHLTKTAAKDLGKDNIRVNCVCPGIVRTPLHEAYHQSKTELEEFYARRGSAFPLGRVGEPKDVSGVIKFLLSPDASWVTGEIFVVDGGRLLL